MERRALCTGPASECKRPKNKETGEATRQIYGDNGIYENHYPILRVGFEKEANGRSTAFNAAMSYNMKNAVKMQDQETVLDYPRVLVARGPVTPARDIHAEIIEGELQVRWNPDIEKNASPGDMAMIVVYNPAKQQSVYDLNLAKRADATAIFSLPTDWEGDTIHAYLAFKTPDGANVSDSIYILF